ncbi:MAG: flavodoxin family protein [Butyrivibrio sp.]|nr:flavodoxin family protein [Acetatifactor muris]MCM1560911.1 flavodoxin family protein [Butyrivibrio sp.]
MSKKVFVLSTGFRKDGNADRLAQEFARGVLEAGHKVEQVNLSGRQIECCRGCFACQKKGHCIIRDDVAGILEGMRSADVLAFATPVYFYGMCGTMKTFLDRTYPLFPGEYTFRDVYLLAAAGENLETTVRGTVEGLNGWIRCFDKTRLTAVVFAGGVMEKGDIEGHPALMKAYQTGKGI